MKETVALRKKEQGKLVVSKQIEKSKMLGKKAAEVSGYKTNRHLTVGGQIVPEGVVIDDAELFNERCQG